ncbi:MAG: hypothetical protein HY260_20470 [Chloroflexi bacterium]|nr:hypothetical protein [Chloroflexota bacterium]
MKYKVIFLIALIAFSVTLAVIVGQRLSAEAMAVIVGVVAGVAASIPTSLIVVWIATRPSAGSRTAAEPPTRAEESRESKIVVVHQPAQPQPPAYPYGNPYPQPQPHYAPSAFGGVTSPYVPLPAPRTFTVIGGETLEDAEPIPVEARWQQ